MSGRSYAKKEIAELGYVAFVCVALAFTTLTRATAGTNKRWSANQDASRTGVCSLSPPMEQTQEKRACELGMDTNSSVPLSAAFLDAKFSPYTNGTLPLQSAPKRRAD